MSSRCRVSSSINSTRTEPAGGLLGVEGCREWVVDATGVVEVECGMMEDETIQSLDEMALSEPKTMLED